MTSKKGIQAKVLVVTTVHWPATTCLGLALARSGFAVAAIGPADHALRKLGPPLDAYYVCHPHFGTTAAIATAIEHWQPDTVVPGDDRALYCLHRLHARASRGLGRDPDGMLALIEESLGDSRNFSLIQKKSDFVTLAKTLGLRVPHTDIIRGEMDLDARLAEATFPQVLKADGTWGGLGVCIVRNSDEARRAYDRLGSAPSGLRIARQIVQHFNFKPLHDRLTGKIPAISLQSYVEGRPANRAVVCWKGAVLAGLSVEVLQTDVETGPATVVRIIDDRPMAEMAARIVRELGLSGFCGFDFILDQAGDAHLIEMNARATQICHLSLNDDADMAGALYAKVVGTARRSLSEVKHDVIAFFPQELWRDPRSKYLFSAYHDVPWDEPRLISAYLRPERRSWIDRMHDVIRAADGLRDQAASIGAPTITSTPPVVDKGSS